MEKRQLGLRITQALTDSIKSAATRERLSINEYITRKLEDLVDSSVELSKKKELPEIAAIYIVTNEIGQVLYVGQTTNLRHRWSSHHKFAELKKLNLININWFSCEQHLLIDIEDILIELLQPQLNIQTSLATERGNKQLKDKLYNIRFSQQEWDKLQAQAKLKEMSVAEVIRDFVKGLPEP